jgi:hypothetical protein
MKKLIIKISLILLISLVGIFIGAYIFMPFTDPYRTSIEFINTNDQVNQYLGKIVKSRLSFMGWSLRYRGPTGSAQFEFQVTGEKGKGVIYINLIKSAGVWNVTESNLVQKNGAIIPLAKKDQGLMQNRVGPNEVIGELVTDPKQRGVRGFKRPF